MALGYGITGISPLGTMGLGAAGGYGAYDAYMPSAMGMGLGTGLDSTMYGMGNMGMLGMLSPEYYLQMAQMQGQINAMQEKNKALLNRDMHSILMGNEVSAHRETDSMLIDKILTNGDVQNGIKNLYDEIQTGNNAGICHEFDKLKNYIYHTYKDELQARGSKSNASVSATEIIESIYGRMITAQTGQPANLRQDIERLSEGAWENGFKQGFYRGHHDGYTQKTYNHIFGNEIDNKGTLDFRQTIGCGAGHVARGFKKAGEGFAVGSVGTLSVLGVSKLALSLFGLGKHIPLNLKTLKHCGRIGVAAALLAPIVDIIWQNNK